MVSGGLGATDVGNARAIGGYAREFFDRIRAYYTKKYGAGSQQVKDAADGFRFEPHVAEIVFKEMLAEQKVQVLYDKRLSQVTLQDKKIISILAGQMEIAAQVFIDASYEGDLLAKANVSYAIGRERREAFNETIAGVQFRSQAHQWPVQISPYLSGKALLPLIQRDPAGDPGAGDTKIQAYNFRMCMTQVSDRKLPWPKPANYDPKSYELLARYLEKKPDLKVGQLMNPVKLPNSTTDTNNNGPFSTDHIGANWDYPKGDTATRARIWQDHIDYQMGFCYFLANDPRVPAKLQQEMNSWGLAKDEFTDTNNWPHQLYVRESRRMKGEYFMIETDIMKKRTKDDSVGLGSYNTDSHHVQRVVGPDGFVLNEGDFQVRVQPYAIPYRSLVPKQTECRNLLVPVCMSASHVAYGTIRMEPVYMILGQATGVAAALAVADKIDAQAIAVEKLLTKLKTQKAVLSPEGLVQSGNLGQDPAKMAGVVVDDEQATKTGAWVTSTSTAGYVGTGYLHDNNEGQGRKAVRFSPKLNKEGRYEVRLFYPAHANRASNALVVIHSAEGEKMVRVNQKQAAKEGFPLGMYRFAAGTNGWVEIRNDDANGFVIADAVQWLPKEK
jgi:FAD dependent oxidoreductase